MPLQEQQKVLLKLVALRARYKSNIAAVGLKEATKSMLLEIDLHLIKDLVKTSCIKGCNFCCYYNVSVSSAEALLLLPHVTPERKAVLEEQAAYSDSNTLWSTLPYKKRKCAFLQDGKCGVYADRPSACRKYYVVSVPEKCSTEEKVQQVRPIALTEAEIISLALGLEQGVGSMPKQILKLLNFG